MNARSDTDLIAASREGDTRAFAALVERHQTMACAVTYSATGDRALSEDLAQDAFILAWRRLAELDEPARFRPWLCGVARNLARNAKRKRRHEVAMNDSAEYEADAPSPADVMSDRQQEQAMWRALEQVPETYREPLVLFYREGQSAKEVAAALGISASAVDQRLSRGRKQLREGVRELVAAGLARTAKPAAGFTAAVMAGIAALPAEAAAAEGAAAPAVAAPASGLASFLSSPGWLTAGLAVAAVAVAIAVGSSSTEPEPDAATQSASVERERAPADDEARTEWAAKDEARAHAAQRDHAAATERLPQPATVDVDGYQLSIMSPRQVAVALDGGQTGLSIFPGGEPPEPLPTVRHWTGRVLDDAGDPVPDAVVVAGPHLRKMLGDSIVGAVGAVTDADGRFDLALTTADPVQGLAMRSGRRWSATTPLEGGTDDVQRDLVVGPTAAIHGRVTHGGKPVIATIAIAAGGAHLNFVTEADGRFAIAPLPPGDLEVLAREGGELVLSGAWVERTVAVAGGDDLRIDFDLPVGSLVAFDLVPPEDVAFDSVTYVTVRGEHRFEDVEALEAAFEAAPASDRRKILHGGIDLDDPAQLADVPAGPHTACVHGERIHPRPPEGPRPPRELAFFACRVVEVDDPGTVTPVEFNPTDFATAG